MAVSKVGPTGLSSAVFQLGKNVVDNGSFQVSQRGTTVAGASSGRQLIDRFLLERNGSASAAWTYSQEDNGGIGGAAKWAKLLVTTADASPGANEANSFAQNIEAQNCQGLLNTTTDKIGPTIFSADVYFHADGASSLSFPIKVSCFIRTIDGTARQYVTDVSITANDTWQRVSVVIPADATATIDNNAASGLTVGFGLYGGTGRVAATATWENTGADNITANSVNTVDATNNFFGTTRWQLESGATPTDFEIEPINVTLAKCQRHFWRMTEDYPFTSGSVLAGSGGAMSTTFAVIDFYNPVPMRAVPTRSTSAVTDFSMSQDKQDSLQACTADGGAYGWATELVQSGGFTASGGGLTAEVRTQLFIENGSGGFMQFSAEL